MHSTVIRYNNLSKAFVSFSKMKKIYINGTYQEIFKQTGQMCYCTEYNTYSPAYSCALNAMFCVFTINKRP